MEEVRCCVLCVFMCVCMCLKVDLLDRIWYDWQCKTAKDCHQDCLLCVAKRRFQDMLFNMKGTEKRVMELVGVKEGYVHNRMTGKVNKRALENEKRVSR